MWERETVQANVWNDRSKVEEWRAAWAEVCNWYLSMERVNVRIDHRSYARQGVEQEPGHHSKSLLLSGFQPAPIDTKPPAPYAHTERKPYAVCLCISYRPPVSIPLSHQLFAGLSSRVTLLLTVQARRHHRNAHLSGEVPLHILLTFPAAAQPWKSFPPHLHKSEFLSAGRQSPQYHLSQ